ncbi:hypothetical protein [[Kitasatospora] papulosa]|uniref:hypothetical protein n=1 Tax=[Kitasatospora] papulosa TaxID=1464011 RepID=UPI00367D3C49
MSTSVLEAGEAVRRTRVRCTAVLEGAPCQGGQRVQWPRALSSVIVRKPLLVLQPHQQLAV